MNKRFAIRAVLAPLQIGFVTLLVFVLFAFSPGDAARNVAGEFATPVQVARVRNDLGLNDPVLVRYGHWVAHAVHGDLADSWVTKEPVSTILWRALGTSLSLVLVAMILAVSVALVFGTLSALRPHGVVDRVVSFLSSLWVAMPGFWIALILVSVFAIKLRWLPSLGYVGFSERPWEWLRHMILPAIALAGVTTAELTRQLRGSLQDALASDYVLAARAKGMSGSKVVMKHTLKNALSSTLAVLAVRVSQLLGGTVIIENIFNMRGLGLTVVRSAQARDIPVVVGVAVITSLVVLICAIAVDLIHPYLNPKLRIS